MESNNLVLLLIKKRSFIIFLIIIFSVFMVGCNRMFFKPKNTKTKEIENIINSHLKIGDSFEKISYFLESQNWPYSYDDFSRRIQCSYPESKSNYLFIFSKIIGIYIYLDESKSFKKAVVEVIYSGL